MLVYTNMQVQEDLITKIKQTFDLSKLIEFLHQTYIFTEDVKCVLKSNCNEAIFSLKPWCTENNTPQGFSKDICTCSKIETEIEEIVTGISKTLVQTEQLREKLSSNLIKEKNLKRPNESRINNLQTAGNRKQEQVTNFNTNHVELSVSKGDIKKNAQETNLNIGPKMKVTRENISSSSTKIKDNKQLIVCPGKFMRNKNFLAINKHNIKNKCNMKNQNELNKRKGNNNKIRDNCTSTSFRTKIRNTDDKFSQTSTNELKYLIQKVSSKSNNYIISNIGTIKCPLHEQQISPLESEQNLVTIDIVDSINLSHIPEQIVKALKLYHTYLNTEFSKKCIIHEKREKTFDKFLVEFNKIDTIVQKTHDIKPLSKYMSFFQILFSDDVEMFNSNNIKIIYNDLQSTCKTFEMEQVNTMQILKLHPQKVPLRAIPNMIEWLSNGIWNPSFIKNFKGSSMDYCIRYTNKNYLLSLFELMQQLQYIVYYKDLINMLLKEVLPNIKIFFNSTESEYIKMYKMIYVLYQGLNPKVPILVSTNK